MIYFASWEGTMFSMRRVGIALALGLSMLLWPLSAPPASAAEREVIIGTAKDTQTSPGIVIAEEKGFFAKHGLKVSVRFFGNGAELIQAMAGGSVPIGVPGIVPATAARAAGVPVELLAPMVNVAGAQALVVNPSITKPSQLEGKSIAIVKGTTAELFYRAVIKRYNLNPNKIQVQYLDGPGEVTALQRGDIQGAFIFQPNVLRAQSLGMRVLLTGTRSYIPGQEGPQRTFADYAVLAARKDFVDSQAPVARDIIAAIADAYAYMADHFDDSANILSNVLGQPPDEIKIFMKQNVYEMNLTGQFINDIGVEAQFLASVGVIKQPLDPKSWINDSILRSVRPEFVSR